MAKLNKWRNIRKARVFQEELHFPTGLLLPLITFFLLPPIIRRKNLTRDYIDVLQFSFVQLWSLISGVNKISLLVSFCQYIGWPYNIFRTHEFLSHFELFQYLFLSVRGCAGWPTKSATPLCCGCRHGKSVDSETIHRNAGGINVKWV